MAHASLPLSGREGDPALPGSFQSRHIGPRSEDVTEMLAAVGAASLDALVDEALPTDIRHAIPLDLPPAESEPEFLLRMRKVASRNVRHRSYIGLGYYDTVTPAVIQRNVFENPGWYTPYTPYQAEVAQGRLEALLNFQTTVQDLTAMDVANASLLDEATAAAEAMAMLRRVRSRKPGLADRFVVSTRCFPQTLDVLRGRAEPLGIELCEQDEDFIFDDRTFGLLVQYPDAQGAVRPLGDLIARAHDAGVFVAVASDLLALTTMKPPGELGADVVVGSTQRFGIPMGGGGPHAAFYATLKDHVRQLPGRLVGVSADRDGRLAYRMAMQTREQHIRRERATSNICTSQALLANMAGFYAMYHGPDGLQGIAERVHGLACALSERLGALGFEQRNENFFDTLHVVTGSADASRRIRAAAESERMNFRYFGDGDIGIALDETTRPEDVDDIAAVFENGRLGQGTPMTVKPAEHPELPVALRRTSAFLTHPVFSKYHSELQMMRYLKRLERKDLGLDTSMIPLGSCTMKLTGATEMQPVSWPEFAGIHPFTPAEQLKGYYEIFDALAAALREITGFAAVSLQPNSGAQGEFAGLMVIRAYHHSRGDSGRDVVLIPSSAHGTNPASAALAGMQIVIIACDEEGNVDVADLREKAATYRTKLNALMITYPSTHGVFEESIRKICDVVHDHGGQVYMDGANMNAQVGLTSPAAIGADVCHLNLHKTFAIPHGGGGPGMGPIAVAEHLTPFLPGHTQVSTGGDRGIRAVSAAPFGSASILLISYAYLCLLGTDGVTQATRVAILNANYIKSRLEDHFDVLYTRSNGRVAHELIFDLRSFRVALGITEQDIAKRLMDYGFHAPTVSFPVAGTLMVEPTESEPRDEIDRFCDAMIRIRQEIRDIADGFADRDDNVLKNAPHTAEELTATDWMHSYSREDAAFPLPFVRARKYWPPISRIDDAYGDRHLVCSCPPIEAYVGGVTSGD